MSSAWSEQCLKTENSKKSTQKLRPVTIIIMSKCYNMEYESLIQDTADVAMT